MDRASRDAQYVSLPTAAAVVLFRLTGKQVEGSRSDRTKAVLNDVAHAMANIVPIYVPNPVTAVKPLAARYLINGRFDGGGRVFVVKDGTQFARLSVQRRDMLTAISILQSAKVSFRQSP
jgi:hypothetical protein